MVLEPKQPAHPTQLNKKKYDKPKKEQPQQNQLTVNEVVDMITGHLERANSLLQLLKEQ